MLPWDFQSMNKAGTQSITREIRDHSGPKTEQQLVTCNRVWVKMVKLEMNVTLEMLQL